MQHTQSRLPISLPYLLLLAYPGLGQSEDILGLGVPRLGLYFQIFSNL